MLGFSWTEILVIMMVALVVIGPKDLPVAIRTASAAIRKMRGLANEFQGHVHDLMREADLADVRNDLRSIRNFDLGSLAERHIDPEGDFRHAFDPTSGGINDIDHPMIGSDVIEEGEAEHPIDAPAFIPPNEIRHRPIPPFIPPGTRLW
ncbi:MAG: Sec-independent protein translocase protein TatB [Acidiphilium sp.]|nr:Sec-independent protein translocase protein TatB [Acidiphilium sp.]MDD4935813.1 Sec-independent protein translocase protein TatB [Acidiphilium sp.]